MKILILIGLLLCVFYFFGKFLFNNRLLNDKIINHSKMPTVLDFVRAGFIITLFIVFIIIATFLLIGLAVRFLIIAIPVGVVLVLIYMAYLGYKLFKK